MPLLKTGKGSFQVFARSWRQTLSKKIHGLSVLLHSIKIIASESNMVGWKRILQFCASGYSRNLRGGNKMRGMGGRKRQVCVLLTAGENSNGKFSDWPNTTFYGAVPGNHWKCRIGKDEARKFRLRSGNPFCGLSLYVGNKYLPP